MIGTPAAHVNKGNPKNTPTEKINMIVAFGVHRLAHAREA
jgi:hypothetical protein